MGKAKKDTGNQDANLPSVDAGSKKKTQGRSSGESKSEGGSRQGNAGHERTSSDAGSRQPKS